jgi:hypothetical protein
MTDDSDMFLLCDDFTTAKGSRLSSLGEPRRSAALGEPELNKFGMAERALGRGNPKFGDRPESMALVGVFPLS